MARQTSEDHAELRPISLYTATRLAEMSVAQEPSVPRKRSPRRWPKSTICWKSVVICRSSPGSAPHFSKACFFGGYGVGMVAEISFENTLSTLFKSTAVAT